ncbi:MAG: deoxyribodipyrimidine photo-lyase [Rubrobacter sp.]|nr:deoxyribodipyrimidine photo-lyase [Rubrobacter sp.]
MATARIQQERIKPLNRKGPREDGRHVLYWMQASQRAEHNHALEYAIQQANALGRTLVCVFGLTDDYPEANLRHYAFMLEGLVDVGSGLRRRGIGFAVRRGSPDEVALRAGRNAALIVTDRGYLRHQVGWRENVASEAGCGVVQVESDVVVPVEVASDRREYAARTFRPRIGHHLDRFLVGLRTTPLRRPSAAAGLLDGVDLSDPGRVLEEMDLDRGVGPVGHLYPGGSRAARRLARRFFGEGLAGYAAGRSQPHAGRVSHMSKYLHFGHISPVYLALETRSSGAPEEDVRSFLEELIVRRELAVNFVYHTRNYDSYSCLPGWARQTLGEHGDDPREHVYTPRQLEEACTHDPYWNAAMVEMRSTGYLHNHMRMYWGKRILGWTRSPQQAYRTALYLNNKYFLDGRDPNSYANVAWIFGLHDRPWKERPVFGKVRYMSKGGLERKTNPEAYVRRVERLTGVSLG